MIFHDRIGNNDCHAAQQSGVVPRVFRAAASNNPIVQRNGTGIAAAEFSDAYVSEAKGVISDEEWQKRTPQQRNWDLIGLASRQLQVLGMPQITGEDANFTDGTNAAFMPALWMMQVAEVAFGDNRTSEQRGRLVAAIYHEARHAEQYFRVAKMLARKGKETDAIAKELKLNKDVAAAAAKVGKAEAKQKQPKQGSQAALEGKQRQEEEERWHQSMGVNQEMSEVKKRIDAQYDNALRELLTTPRDLDVFKRYQVARDQRRQAYIMYQKTAVEADAWDTQGLVEQKLELSVHGLEEELQQMERNSPDPRRVRPVEREGPLEPAVGTPSVSLGAYLKPSRGQTPVTTSDQPSTSPTPNEAPSTTTPTVPFRARAKARPTGGFLGPQSLTPETPTPDTGTPTVESDDLTNLQLKRIQRHAVPPILEEVVAHSQPEEGEEKEQTDHRR